MENFDEVIDTLKDEWIKIGLNTDPIDVPAATKIISKIYENAGLPPPEITLVAPSPPDALRMWKTLPELGWEAIKASNDPQKLVLEASRGVRLTRSEPLINFCFGNMSAPILGFYDYFLNYKKLDGLDRIAPFIDLAKVCGWWMPLGSVAILVNRPNKLKFDEKNLAHCEDGPAIAFADSDFAVYMWHGVRIPADWIENRSSITPEVALTHPNMEQRRVACEMLGWDNILDLVPNRVIDTDPDPYIGQLIEVDLPELGTERFLRVTCGTGRKFAIPVPPDVETALDANSWTYGVAANEYVPEIRT